MPKEAVVAKFISVYAKSTGEKHRVPEHFLTVPSIARNFNKTPRQRSRDKADETPVATNTEAALAAEDETPDAGDKKE